MGKKRKTPTLSKLMNFGQGYMTPKFCGPKFKNGGDMAMGAKTGKPPLLKKVKFFAQKYV